jgi:hypothetical protein
VNLANAPAGSGYQARYRAGYYTTKSDW